MKNLILILMFILPSVVFSQRDGSKVMDVNNIDYRLLDSLIVVEVNKVRDSLGNNTMCYSRMVSDNVSKGRCEKLKNEQRVYHPSGRSELYSDKVESLIIKESKEKYGVKSSSSVIDGFEICLFEIKEYKYITYHDMSLAIVNLWQTSPAHRMVVRDVYKEKESKYGKQTLMAGVSTKYGVWDGSKGFYVVLNLTVVFED